MRKYRNIKTGGFDSKKEAKRAQELTIMAAAGLISDLAFQVRYLLIPSQRNAFGKAERPCYYISDFVYVQDGKTVVEDCKGVRTSDYIIKRKLMLMVHGITILES